MANNYCIPKELINSLKERVMSLGESGQVATLAQMASKQRVKLFSEVIPETDAVRLNQRFEKAVGQKKLDALKKWVNDNLDEKYRQDEVQFNMKRYKNLDAVNDYIESRMELLSEQKLGIALTDAEVKKMTELGKEYYDKSLALGDNLGKIGHEDANIAWGKAYKALSDEREKLIPVSFWKSWVQTFSRATMLASFKTPFLNIESNTVQGVTEAVRRRVSSKVFYSNTTRQLQQEYRQFARRMFKETGVDFTRMISLDDSVAGMGKLTGETSARLKNPIAHAFTDFVFNKTLSVPDVLFSSLAFTDSLSLHARMLAKGDEALERKLFEEATNVNAVGDAGVLRQMAIADARYATATNESFSSKVSEKVRDVLNMAGGIGDWLMPFVRTPANFAEISATYAGFGFVKGAFTVGASKMKNGVIDKSAMRSAMADIVRAGLGTTAATLLASQFESDDFVGAYDPARFKIDQLANAGYNAIRIDTPLGERWVSVDYLGPLASSFVAAMYMKKYGTVADYVQGATSQYLAAIPAADLESVTESISSIASGQGFVKYAEKTAGNFGSDISGRLVPGVISDIARAVDGVQRDTKQAKYVDTSVDFADTFVNKTLASFVQKLPFLRETLPKKTDALGRVMVESTPLESMFFGSRVKTVSDDKVTDEILRLRDTGNTPNVKDLRTMSSTNVTKLKSKLGEKRFITEVNAYGQKVGERYKALIKTEKYRRANNEDKAKMLSDIGEEEYQALLKRNGI